MTESQGIAGTVLNFPASDSNTKSSSSPPKLPQRLRRRLRESKSPSITVEEIEAKLKGADLRRQQFYELISSKARLKLNSPSWSSLQEGDQGQRLKGKLNSAEQKRRRRQFVRLKGTTSPLAKAFVALNINEGSVKVMPFEQLALQIESAETIKVVKALLDRFESCITLRGEATCASDIASLEHIDHLLKRVVSPRRRGNVCNASRGRGVKKIMLRRELFHSADKLSRYPVRVVLCAYMILGHPDAVFNGKGEHEIALAESAESFVRAFELLIKVILDGPIQTTQEGTTSSDPSGMTFRSQIEAFDKAWCSYLYRFVTWKVKDANLLEEDLVRAACQMELSMMQICKMTPGDDRGLPHDLKPIQKQVTEDQMLLREKVQHLSGSAGVERMECALSETRSRFFEAKGHGSSLTTLAAHRTSPSSPWSSDGPEICGSDEIKNLAENHNWSNFMVCSLFKAVDSSPGNEFDSSTSRCSMDGNSNSGEVLVSENEVLVNEIVHGHRHGFTDGLDISNEDQKSIKAKLRETMENAFWDGIMESMKQDEPDYNWVCKLMKEVRDELCDISPSSWRQDIVETIDIDILSQVLKSRSLDLHYLGKILEFALLTLHKLSAAASEDEVKTTHHILLQELGEISQAGNKSNASFSLVMMKGLRFVLQQIQALRHEISIARIRILEPLIKGHAGLEYLQKSFTNRYGSPNDAPASLPLTMQWLSAVRVDSEQEWDQYMDSLSAFRTSNIRCPEGLPSTIFRTGGSVAMASKNGSPATIATVSEQECKGEKVDLLLRLCLLKLVSEVEGLTVETMPETLKLNLSRLRSVQSQFQKIIVISTSILVLQQALLSEKLVTCPVDMENIVSQCVKRLSELLDNVEDVGISEIVETMNGFSNGNDVKKLQARKEVMANLLAKSLRAGDAICTRISRTVYLAARGVVLGGSGIKGRELAEMALRRVGAALLTEKMVEAAEVLVVVARVSSSVHGPWYDQVIKNI